MGCEGKELMRKRTENDGWVCRVGEVNLNVHHENKYIERLNRFILPVTMRVTKAAM